MEQCNHGGVKAWCPVCKSMPTLKHKKKTIKFPEWDEIEMKPKSKMPNCPICGEDELSMINKDLVVCNNCNFKQIKFNMDIETKNQIILDKIFNLGFITVSCTDETQVNELKTKAISLIEAYQSDKIYCPNCKLHALETTKKGYIHCTHCNTYFESTK
jgi:ribosomal protein L37AE/L43A